MVDISDWADLDNIRNDLTGTYNLVNDLTPSTAGYDTHASINANGGSGWSPIGDSSNQFTGVLDGNNYNIEGLYIDRTTQRLGLVAEINGATVRDINFIDADITGTDNRVGTAIGSVSGDTGRLSACSSINCNIEGVNNVGGLVGTSVFSGIDNCFTSGTITGEGNIAGICGGFGNGSTIRDCYSNASITNIADSTGGVAGISNIIAATPSEDKILRCGFGGDITSSAIPAGGVIGELPGEATVTSCYSVCNIDAGGNEVGGIVGRAQSGSFFGPSRLEKSYSSPSVTNPGVYGGLMGDTVDSGGSIDVVDSYWDESVSGTTDAVGGNAGILTENNVNSLPTANMQGSSASSNMSGLDFSVSTTSDKSDDVFVEVVSISAPVLATLEIPKNDGYPILISVDEPNSSFEGVVDSRKRQQLQSQGITSVINTNLGGDYVTDITVDGNSVSSFTVGNETIFDNT